MFINHWGKIWICKQEPIFEGNSLRICTSKHTPTTNFWSSWPSFTDCGVEQATIDQCCEESWSRYKIMSYSCNLPSMWLVIVEGICYEAPMDQWLEKRGLLVARLRLRSRTRNSWRDVHSPAHAKQNSTVHAPIEAIPLHNVIRSTYMLPK